MAEASTRGEVILRCRREMSIGGVEEVVSFDDEGVKLKTCDGELLVEGEGIKIDTLDTERGIVRLEGKINGFYYSSEPDKQKRGFFGRLVR